MIDLKKIKSADELPETHPLKKLLRVSAGRKRSTQAASQAALWQSYFFPPAGHPFKGFSRPPVDDLLLEIRRALETKDGSFFKDLAFFLENPARKFSLRKWWLVEIHYLSGKKEQPLFTGEELAEKWTAFCIEQGGKWATLPVEEPDVSQIYRECRELGIPTKHPRKHRKSSK